MDASEAFTSFQSILLLSSTLSFFCFSICKSTESSPPCFSAASRFAAAFASREPLSYVFTTSICFPAKLRVSFTFTTPSVRSRATTRTTPVAFSMASRAAARRAALADLDFGGFEGPDPPPSNARHSLSSTAFRAVLPSLTTAPVRVRFRRARISSAVLPLAAPAALASAPFAPCNAAHAASADALRFGASSPAASNASSG
mmetsp:Transcript_2606/g.10883  ORF Transcript_2606/g.10883 Transcript_2606/m.10883 type:complete len:201 (+) Transcript_2606:177-779(+)